jgi:drug/metabolite transporter (DMT)-like permease
VWVSTYPVTTEFLPLDRPPPAAVLGTLSIGIFMYLSFVAAYRLPGGIAAFVTTIQPVVVIFLAAPASTPQAPHRPVRPQADHTAK